MFQQPLCADFLVATWVWMIGLIDTWLYNYKMIPQQFEMTRIMQAITIKTVDLSRLTDMVGEVMHIYRQ